MNQSSSSPESLALIVPTRNRYEYLRPRFPGWAAAGFNEVIVVNTPGDPKMAVGIKALCEDHGVRYIETPRTFRDLRSRARNMGAREARSSWILFCDDDVDVITHIDQEVFRRATKGRDWLAGEKGDIVVLHRRESFLAFGGYPEDMVASEDTIMSNRARRHGRGGPLEQSWARAAIVPQAPRQEPVHRVRAHFWYSLTLPLFLLRTPRFREAIISDAHRTLSLGKRALAGDMKSLVYLVVYMIGRVFSPVHLLAVLARSGKQGFARETEASWAGVRPD